MSGHLSCEQIDSFSRGTSAGADLIAVYDHIADCGECRVRLATEAGRARSVESVLSTLAVEAASTESHLEYEEMEALVDGSADETDRESMESHIEVCGLCASEMAELRALKAQLVGLAAAPQSWERPAQNGTMSVPFWGWRSQRWLRVAVAAAALAAAVGIVWFVATIPLRNRITVLNSEIAELRRANEDLKSDAANVADLQNRTAQLEKERAKGPEEAGAGGGGSAADHEAGTGPDRLAERESVKLRDGGGTFILDASNGLHAPGVMQSQDAEAVKSALVARQVEPPPIIAGLAGRYGMLRGASEGVRFGLQSPVGTAVLTDRPTFRWRGLEGASHYTVAIYDASFNQVATSPPLNATEWTVAQPLQRGFIYSWQVTAAKDGKLISSPTSPAPEARFLVLDQAGATRLAQAKQTYGNSHLVLGVLYARAGLLDDAEQELRALAKANPGSTVARKLLAGVSSIREKGIKVH
jgi:hypothetical protein